MTIRPLTTLAELQQCVDLQRETWGLADLDVMPLRMFVTSARLGGLVLGAFDGERFVGFASATPAIRQNRPSWYSQMLAVAKDNRDAGVGVALKLAQRDHALKRGLHLIEWTFDPLESKNAYLNLVKLGVIVRTYYVNLYGATDSDLQRGLESDRLVAEWWIEKPRITIGEEVRRVYIPADIQSLKKQSVKSAQDVQLRVREQFLKNFEDDYFVAGFDRRDKWSEYLFIPGASRVHQTD
jgi:predicted GNAT superfamily acetyltransferase